MVYINTKALSRRASLQVVLAGLGVIALAHSAFANANLDRPLVTVWKTPSCGCRKDWVVHLRKEGFEVVTNDVNDTAPIRQKLGLPTKFDSCHTAQVGGYVLEGHVPASEVKRLLREKPAAIGLAVPDMPVGSPGMEMNGEMLGLRDAFDVVLVTKDGGSRVYKFYGAKAAAKNTFRSDCSNSSIWTCIGPITPRSERQVL